MRIASALLLFLTLLCSSCVVSFENPLSSEQMADKRLLGRWIAMDKADAVFEFSLDTNSQTVLKFVEEDNLNEKAVFTVTSFQINDKNLLSLKLYDEEKDATFLLAKYKIEGDEISVWLLDKAKISELIEQGKIKGVKKSYGEISVSNSQEEIINLLNSPGSDELFEFFGKLKKQ